MYCVQTLWSLFFSFRGTHFRWILAWWENRLPTGALFNQAFESLLIGQDPFFMNHSWDEWLENWRKILGRLQRVYRCMLTRKKKFDERFETVWLLGFRRKFVQYSFHYQSFEKYKLHSIWSTITPSNIDFKFTMQSQFWQGFRELRERWWSCEKQINRQLIE